MQYIIALDIGGTKMEGALLDQKFKVLRRIRLPAPHGSRRQTLFSIDGLIRTLHKGKIWGIGVSFPSLILPGGRIGRVCKIRSLRNYPLQDHLSRKHSCPVIVANDADCFALGEHLLGAAKGTANSIGLIWGTGIGAGIIINHRLYYSSFGSAAEAGHNVLDPDGPKNPIGVRGDVESFAGGKSIAVNYRAAGGRKNVHASEIFDLRERPASHVISVAMDKIALLCSHIQNILDPEIIVVGGGISNRPIYKELNRLTKRYTFPMFRKHVKIVRHKLGDSAGIYGAAALILNPF